MTEPDKRRRDPTRVRYPKVKTGCVTCRNRRVKCDETRPSCLRCRKYGTECGGYLPGRRRPPSSAYGSFATQARALVPKDEGQLGGQLTFQPAMSLFETDLEHRYFRLFSDHIATEICPYFNPETWSRMILQACAADASIRHAAVAIGALGKTYETAQAGSCAVTGQKFTSSIGFPAPRVSIENRSVEEIVASANLATEAYEHHQTALEQYDKALKRMRKDISSGEQSLRTTLLICIVIVCFEAIHGNHISAAAQLQGGLALVQDWMSRQQDAHQHPQGFSSPAPDDVEDYLVQTFGRMEIQSMSVFDPRPVEKHHALRGEGKQAVQQMPTPFSSIEQARVYLDLITRRLMHYNHSIHPRGPQQSCLPVKVTPMPWALQSTPQPMPWIDGKIPLPNANSTLSQSDLHAEQASLNQELTTWTEAFAPLLSLSQTIGGQDAISALTLSVSALTSKISLRAAFFINESAYDLFLPEFKTIVQYSTLLLALLEQQQLSKPSPSFSPSAFSPSSSSPSTSHPPPLSERTECGLALRFSFDIAVVPPLYTVVIKCRDPHIRRAALKLLDRYPRREGVWDSVAVAGLGRWVMALEEEGALRWQSASPPDTTTPSPYPSTTNSKAKSRSPSIPHPGQPSPSSSSYYHPSTPQSSYSNGTIPAEKPPREYPIIPEEMRVRKAIMRFDLLERRANMSCMQMDFGSGKFVDKREVFRW
ncbi:hypothetical protein L207DRAFT_531343 [Hyaloscypha variabilis F]|uniref:Zn(2)-C6 fungal-type domain-containing protein n=1 Tax=Hyaloscypha variabilis (strain UAMH 11265 / GT02V1 / F) TaxID=1149755 RepID=A0A2J6RIU5_HYAVF|nr:hypothetical protein L207DRAFT_531343 [Hyaloscypha variabilis F]